MLDVGTDADVGAAIKQWLLELRHGAGLSQEEVAEELGVPRKTIYNAESPKQGLPNAINLVRMLQLYGVLDGSVIRQQIRQPSLSARLVALEGQVGQAAELTVAAIERLATEVRELRQDRLSQDGLAKRAQ